MTEITDEKHDDPFKDNFQGAEEILDYHVGKGANLPLFAEFIDNTANDDLSIASREILFEQQQSVQRKRMKNI